MYVCLYVIKLLLEVHLYIVHVLRTTRTRVRYTHIHTIHVYTYIHVDVLHATRTHTHAPHRTCAHTPPQENDNGNHRSQITDHR